MKIAKKVRDVVLISCNITIILCKAWSRDIYLSMQKYQEEFDYDIYKAEVKKNYALFLVSPIFGNNIAKGKGLEVEAQLDLYSAYIKCVAKSLMAMIALGAVWCLQSVANAIKVTVNKISDFFISANRSFVAGKEYVGSSINAGLDYASALWNAFKDKVSNNFNSARTTATQAVGTVQTKATQVVESARNTATQAAGYLPNKPQVLTHMYAKFTRNANGASVRQQSQANGNYSSHARTPMSSKI